MANSLLDLKASDGTGEAVVAQVETPRIAGATTIDVNTVDNWPTQFIAMSGTKLPSGYIDQATALLFKGHIDTGNIIIDEIAPGYTDAGNTAGQIVVIKPNTLTMDELVALLQVAHANDGAIKTDAITTPDQFADPVDPALRFRENFFDHVAEGCVLTGTGYGSNLNWSLTSGVVYINGKRYTVAAATGVVVASKDTYFDLLEPVSGQVATLVYTGGNSVANNAASPALASNSVRLGIIVSGGSSIANVAAINQGQEDKILPIASSTPYAVTDSLGNLICPRDPQRKLLGYRQITANFTTTAVGSDVDVTGLSVPVIVPSGRKVKLSSGATEITSSCASGFRIYHAIKESSTQLNSTSYVNPNPNYGEQLKPEHTFTPSAGSHTYKSVIKQDAAGTTTVNASGATAAWIKVELE